MAGEAIRKKRGSCLSQKGLSVCGFNSKDMLRRWLVAAKTKASCIFLRDLTDYWTGATDLRGDKDFDFSFWVSTICVCSSLNRLSCGWAQSNIVHDIPG